MITALHFDLLLDSTPIGEQSLEQTAGNAAEFFFFFGTKPKGLWIWKQSGIKDKLQTSE